jgi:hypothetical protein
MNKYVIKTPNGLLNGVYFGDYPTTSKLYYNEIKNKLEGKFTTKKILSTSNSTDSYIVFETEQEAQNYIKYLLKSVEDERERWEESLAGCTEKVIEIFKNFKIINREVKTI